MLGAFATALVVKGGFYAWARFYVEVLKGVKKGKEAILLHIVVMLN